MASYKIELNSRPNKGSQEHKIMLRITAERKHARMALDYSVKKSQFILNPKEQYRHIRQNNPKHAIINSHINDKIQEAKDVAEVLKKEGKVITSNTIKQRMVQPKSSNIFDFADSIIAELLKNGNIGNYKKYSVVRKVLSEHVGHEKITFQEIDAEFLRGFEASLKEQKKSQTTIHGYIKVIRALFYKAIERELIDQNINPFLSYRLKLGKPSRERLTMDEIKKIENLELRFGEFIWHVKNAFLFSFYLAGIRVSDILLLKWENVQNGRLGYQMHKTGKLHSLKLIDKAKQLLSYYGPKNTDEYVFPFFSSSIDYSNATFLHNQISSKTALINKYLKDIARKAGINKKISTHTARHSFADIARKKTDNIYNLSKTLGHSDLKTTEAYLASFDEDAVDSTLDDVFN